MQRLLGDLLDVAQIEAGAFAVEPRPYHLSTVLHEAREALLAIVAERRQELVVCSSDLRVRVDRERFLQALSNLVGNASKFSPPQTKITIETRLTASGVEVSVSDEGPGIPADALSSIFDRFVQSTGDPVRRRGVGLGLAIVRGIAAAHGGEVVAENLSSRGARFRMTFPPVADAIRPTAPTLAAFLGSSPEDAAALLALAAPTAALDEPSADGWERGPVEGIWERTLPRELHTRGSGALLVAIARGATYPMHGHESGETLLILSGGLRDNDGVELWAGDSVRNAPDTSHSSTALAGGCLLVAVHGT